MVGHAGKRLKPLSLAAIFVALTQTTAGAEDDLLSLYGFFEPFRVRISGQLNYALLYGNNGTQSDLFFVDNDNSSTRARLVAEIGDPARLLTGFEVEYEFELNSSFVVDFDNPWNGLAENQRKLQGYMEVADFGRLWGGRGSTGSDNTAEVDLSGTSVIAYSSVNSMAGGLRFDGGPRIGDVFSNFDGLGRLVRVRYDSPEFDGFTVSTSGSYDRQWDLALRYAGDGNETGFAAAAAFARRTGDVNQLNASASALFDSGLSLTGAIGGQVRDGRSPFSAYGKIGYGLDELVSFGRTTIGADIAYSRDVQERGDDAVSAGIFAVQTVDDLSTEVYLGVRHHELDRPGESFDGIVAVMTGARFRF